MSTWITAAAASALRLDANESLALETELKAKERELYRKRFLEVTYQEAFPLTIDGPGYKSVSFQSLEEYGEAKWATDKGATPLVDLSRKEYVTKVDIIKLAYKYTHHELQYAAKEDISLDMENANATKRIIDTKVDKTLYLGDAGLNKPGLLSDSAALVEGTVTNDGTGSSKKFEDKDGDKILADINRMFKAVVASNKGMFRCDTMLIAPSTMEILKDRYIGSAGDGKTVYRSLMENRPYLNIIEIPRLESVSGLSDNTVMVIYPKSKEVLNAKVPVPFFTLPGVYTPDYDYQVTCYADVAGLEVKHPKSIGFIQGI